MAPRQHNSVWEDINKNGLEVTQQRLNVSGLCTSCPVCLPIFPLCICRECYIIKKFLQSRFNMIIYFVHVHAWVCAYLFCAFVQRSEGNLQELLLFFHHMRLGLKPLSVSSGTSNFTCR